MTRATTMAGLAMLTALVAGCSFTLDFDELQAEVDAPVGGAGGQGGGGGTAGGSNGECVPACATTDPCSPKECVDGRCVDAEPPEGGAVLAGSALTFSDTGARQIALASDGFDFYGSLLTDGDPPVLRFLKVGATGGILASREVPNLVGNGAAVAQTAAGLSVGESVPLEVKGYGAVADDDGTLVWEFTLDGDLTLQSQPGPLTGDPAFEARTPDLRPIPFPVGSTGRTFVAWPSPGGGITTREARLIAGTHVFNDGAAVDGPPPAMAFAPLASEDQPAIVWMSSAGTFAQLRTQVMPTQLTDCGENRDVIGIGAAGLLFNGTRTTVGLWSRGDASGSVLEDSLLFCLTTGCTENPTVEATRSCEVGPQTLGAPAVALLPRAGSATTAVLATALPSDGNLIVTLSAVDLADQSDDGGMVIGQFSLGGELGSTPRQPVLTFAKDSDTLGIAWLSQRGDRQTAQVQRVKLCPQR